MKKEGIADRILVGITGYNNKDWQSKIRYINNHNITKVALFLERFKEHQREQIYEALLKSKIKDIPLVHIRNDMKKDELAFLKDNFGAKYLTIHEDSFEVMSKWKGFYKNLFMEMNYDNFVPSYVKVEKIGGFCVDLSHFKAGEEKWSEDFKYVLKRKKLHKYFGCNHLNGYSYKRNKDIHNVKSLKEFDYLKTLPEFVFGDVIAIETDNSIAEQLKFRKYLERMFGNK